MVEESCSNTVLDLGDSITKLLRDGLSLESFDSIGMGGCRHDDESHDCHSRSGLLQSVVEAWDQEKSAQNIQGRIYPELRTCKCFNKHIHSLIAVFIPTSSEHLARCETMFLLDSIKRAYVEGVLQVEVVGSIEVATNKLVNLSLALRMQVLEFVHRLELYDIETVRENAVWFALE